MTVETTEHQDYAQAIKYLKLALPEMHRLKVPATPENYSVWYEYATGKNPALIEKIDTLKACNKQFTSRINQDLFDLYVKARSEPPVSQLNNSVKTIIDNLLERIHKQEAVHDAYSESLTSLSREISNINELVDLEVLIQKLIAEAHLKSVENMTFQKRISAMSSEVKELDKKLRRAALDANTDSLTGVPNRRALNIRLRKLITSNTPFSLIMIDIDRFKRLNDTFGHLTGDRVLKFVAQLIVKNIKGSDYLARYGGEEFVLVLPKTNEQNAVCVANNLRKYLSKQKLYDSSEDKKIGHLTLSMGVTERRRSDSLESVIKRADDYLYYAKNNGRNQVINELPNEAKRAVS